MKRFLEFLAEAEAAAPPSIPPGEPGTEQHGPASPKNPTPNIPENVPTEPRESPEPDPKKFQTFEQYWEAYQRWLMDTFGRQFFEEGQDMDLDFYYRQALQQWRRFPIGKTPVPAMHDWVNDIPPPVWG
jgi:hypothetical protein